MSNDDKHGSAPSNQFKLVVTGPPNSGKTSLVHRLIGLSEQSTKGITEVHFCKITSTDPHHWRKMDLGSHLAMLSQRFQKSKVPLSTVDVLHTDKPAASSYTAKNSHISVVIYDVDGDDCNRELLPLLLNPQDIVLLVYNASEVFDDKSFGNLDEFLQSICSHCSAESCKSDQNPHHWPRIVMVGTHADLLTFKSKLAIVNLFHDYGKLFLKHLEPPHLLVDCLNGNIDRLQDTILSAAEPLCNKRCPLSYFMFEFNILKLCHTRMRITKEEALQIANQCSITVRESLLNYCWGKGIILYYPTVESLQDNIFSHKIINILSFMVMRRHLMLLSDEFAQLKESYKRLAVYLLLNFRFAGRLSARKLNTQIGFCYNKESFCIPLLMKSSNYTINYDHVEIFYFFPDGFLPKCVFHQLLASTVDWCYIGNHKIVRLCSNHGQFSFGNWQQFCLDYSPEYITCSVALPPDETAEEIECQYPLLIEFLQKTFNEICALNLPSAQRPVSYLDCPLDHPGDSGDYLHLQLNKITEEADLICSITKKPVPKEYYALLVKLNSAQFGDIKEKEAYALALKEGRAKPSSVRIVVVGTENAGKTCLIESLLGEDFKHHEATQGADVDVCKIFSTNWSRLMNDQVLEKLRKDFCSKLKATVDRKSLGEDEAPVYDETISGASSPENEEESLPTIVITPAVDDAQPGSSSSLCLPLVNEEELPVVSDADLRGVELSAPICENEINAVIWDVSGQTVYHGLLSPFLTEDNVTVIVFDASQDLFNFPQPRNDEYTENSISPKMTGCEIICYWFNSIYSYCHKKSTKNALSRYLPTVFLVATHIDKIGDSKAIAQKKKEIIGLLTKAFEGKPFARLLAGNRGNDGIEEALRKYCFFVSNLVRDLAVFTQLKKALVEASQHLLNQYHPVVFLKIERRLLDLNKDSITTLEFKEIANECGFPVNLGTDKFNGALQYFHHKGIALNFRTIKSLLNVVVLSPQWLVKMLAYVIVAHPFRKFGSTLDKQYECLIKLGIHHKELFDYMVKCFNIWQESSCRGINIDSKQAMDFVEKFNFVAEIDRNIIFLNDMKCYQSLGKPNNKLYIVPSMLPEEIPEILTDPLLQKIMSCQLLGDAIHKDVRIVYFNFPDGFVPITVFSQVVATCIKRNAARFEQLKWLSRYHCKLVLGEDQFYYIILHKQKESICLVFSPDEVEAVTNCDVTERLKLFEEFYENLICTLKAVAKSLKNPIPYIPCPQCTVLHFDLNVIRGASKRALRCKKKISLEYYSDFREAAGTEEDGSPCNSLHHKRMKISTEPSASVSSSSDNIVQDLPSSVSAESYPTLSQWLVYLKGVSSWKSLAAHLLPPDCVVTKIDSIDKQCQGDIEDCKIALYREFDRQGEVTWIKIADALEKSSHLSIAKRIKTDFHL